MNVIIKKQTEKIKISIIDDLELDITDVKEYVDEILQNITEKVEEDIAIENNIILDNSQKELSADEIKNKIANRIYNYK